ncbi:hypothetical protein FDP41_006875 [Naegleria fowleri]|uniref:Uncharacterized protein n=1 Tax=Naegleria fowleri TaxID=5763 RepID=A0A6A5BKW9_NAEFO|nr:uncharacterized protein FDP41_006875 [Naegleria fowleri]KAF0974265.1 hypothetical protein FDP41_006875 [Naegleria fowleri]
MSHLLDEDFMNQLYDEDQEEGDEEDFEEDEDKEDITVLKRRKDQTKDELCQSKLNGGAGLTIEQAQPFYQRAFLSKFDGTTLSKIVYELEKAQQNGNELSANDIVKQIIEKYIGPPPITCETVVNWVVDELIKKRQDIIPLLTFEKNLLEEIEQARHNKENDFQKFYSNTRNELATKNPNKVLTIDKVNEFEQTLCAKTTIPSVKVRFGNSNIGGCEKLSEIISSSGEKRGLLTKFAQLIGTTKKFHVSIFSGTNFSVDVGGIIQSALGKTEAKIDIVKIFDFGLVSRDIISFLEKPFNIPDNEKEDILFYLYNQGYKINSEYSHNVS